MANPFAAELRRRQYHGEQRREHGLDAPPQPKSNPFAAELQRRQQSEGMSGFDVVKGMAQEQPPERHPVRQGHGSAVHGPGRDRQEPRQPRARDGQLLIPGEQGSEKYPRASAAFSNDRYGGWEQIKRTLATQTRSARLQTFPRC